MAADLAITNQVAPTSTLVAGNVVQYDLTVTNSGSLSATATMVTDQLPVGEMFLGLRVPGAATSPSISYDGGANAVTWNAGTIASGGGSVNAIVYALVNTNSAGSLTNTAAAFSPDDPSHSSSASAVTSQQQSKASRLSGGAADLSIGVAAANHNAPVAPGGTDSETYTIVVKNNGQTTATGVQVIDLLPPGSAPGTNSTEPTGVTVTFPQSYYALATLPDLAAGQSLKFTITFDGPDTPPGALVNQAYVTSAGGDTNNSDNFATTVTPVTPAAGSTVDLAITQTNSPNSGTVQQSLVYTITVTNNSSTTDATNVYVTDVLPAGAVYVSGSTSVGGVNIVPQSGAVVSALIPTLAKGTSATLTLTVIPSAGGTVTNTASVESGDDQDSSQSNNVVSTNTHINSFGLIANFVAGTPGDGTDTTFISNLYQELLGRAADSAGLSYWLNYLQTTPGSAGRNQAVSTFMASDEYKTALVTSVYENLLHRAPDAGGLQYWVGALGNPGQPGGHNGVADEKYLVTAIASSGEYYADTGGTDRSWVDSLFVDLLGRTIDSGGETYWTQQAGNLTAATRGTLVLDLLNSAEADQKLLNAVYPSTGTSPAPGALSGGTYALANITGGGWENLYLEGPYIATGQTSDPFFVQLQNQMPWDDVISEMLQTSQFYTNSN
jgi:uncharacterized repeat protein (TIGR01451 family)